MKERKFAVFLSHVMALAIEDLRAEVGAVRAAVSKFDQLELVTFEDTPASGEDPKTRYRRKVAECDALILILGAKVTPAIADEVKQALDHALPLWLFVREPEPSRSSEANEMLNVLRNKCTYSVFDSPARLRLAVESMVESETPRLMRAGAQSIQGFMPSPWIPHPAGPADHIYGPALDQLAVALGEAERNRLEADLQRIKEYLSSGRYTLARRAYLELRTEGRIINFKDLHRKVLNNLAVSCSHLGNGDEALEASAEALRLDPENETGRLNYLATLMSFSRSDWNVMKTSERELLERTSTGLEMLASEAREAGDHPLALRYATRAMEIDPASDAAALNAAYAAAKIGRRAQALELLARVSSSSTFYMQAQISIAEMKLQDARRAENPAAAITDVEAHVGKADAAAGARHLDADDWAETRAHKDVVLAVLATLKGRYDEAIRLLEGLDCNLVPEGVILQNLGQAYAGLSQWDKAIQVFDRILSSDSENLEILDWVAVAHMNRYSQTGDGKDLDTAERALKHLLGNRPSGIVVLNLVELLSETGRVREARDLLEQSLSRGIQDIETDVARMVLARREGDHAGMVRIAEEIYAKKPTEVTAAVLLGRREFVEGRYTEAREKLQNAIADPFCKSSSHPEAYAYLARALKRLGQVERAIEIALEGTARCPEDARLRRLLDEIASKTS